MNTTRANQPAASPEKSAERAEVRNVYQEIATEYDERIPGAGPADELFTDAEFDFILQAVHPADHVLDMGCGTGRFTVPLAERATAVTGLDISSEMLEVNQKKLAERGLKATLQEGDMTALPFPDASFDAVVSMLALMHIPVENRQSVFSEAARVLKPGGRLLIGVKNAVFERIFSGDRFASVDVTDVDAGKLIFTDTKAGPEFEAPWHSFSPEDLDRLTALYGLRVVHLRGNNPLSAWLADAVLQDAGLRGAIERLEKTLSDIPPFSHLGYHLMAEAVKPVA